MSEITRLDAAYEALQAAPEDDRVRLRFFDRLAESTLCLLLERPPEAGQISPQTFETEEGTFVLAFDDEARLADFVGGEAAYASMSGRAVIEMLSGAEVGLGLNLGTGRSEQLLPPDALRWLGETLAHSATELQARPRTLHPPAKLPEALLTALDGKLARAGRLAAQAYLAEVTYDAGRRGHLLAFIDAARGADATLVRAVGEALTFSGLDAGELDVLFLEATDPLVPRFAKVALRFDMPMPEEPPERAPPGSDPAAPPRLR